LGGVAKHLTEFVQTVSAHLTGKNVTEAGKGIAKKWHFLALIGRFWSCFQCHFVLRWADIAKTQTAKPLSFMPIVPMGT
jgi:hypothetical protein